MIKYATTHKDLLIELVRASFKLRYNNSLLGFLWVLLKPFFTFLVLYFVFSKFKGGWVENYQLYLLVGVILYSFISEGIIFGLLSLLEKAHIILKVNFPREIAVFSSLIMAVINFVINLFILGIFVLFNPINTNPSALLYFAFVIFIIFIGLAAIAFFSSIIMIKLRDLQHIVELCMQLLFYATPIFYPIEVLPESARKIVSLSPLTILIDAGRNALIHGEITRLKGTLALFVIAVILLISGFFFFKANIQKVAEHF